MKSSRRSEKKVMNIAINAPAMPCNIVCRPRTMRAHIKDGISNNKGHAEL